MRSEGAQYKVVEATTVTDEALERILNEWTAQGWRFEGMQFAMREASKRPAMAFVLFTRDGPRLRALPETEGAERDE
ncbi:MAG: DUF4177 domain-containing protein [Myxococcales bacterium]